MVVKTSDCYLVYALSTGHFAQFIKDFVSEGNIIDPETDREADLVGWSEHRVNGGNFALRTSPMYLVYLDEVTGQQYFQPWQDTLVSGSLVSPKTDTDMPVVGWSTEPPR